MATLGDSTITNLTVLNNITGKGSGITNLNASNLSSGSIGNITYQGKLTTGLTSGHTINGILVTDGSDSSKIVRVTDAATLRTYIGAGTSSLTLAGNGSATTASKSDHSHGNITNAGKVTTEETTAGNISKLLITNSDGTIKTAAVSKAIPTITVDATNGVSYTAAGASSASATYKYNHPTTTAVAAAAVKVGKDSSGHVVLGDALTKSDVGLGNVNNTAITVSSTNGVSDGTNTYKYTLPSDVVQDSSYNHITVTSTSVSDGTNTFNKPTIPTVNNGTLSIQGNGTTASTFTANQSSNTTLNIKGSGATTVTKSANNEITISSTDNNTTYTFAEGTTNKSFTVTPSGGDPQTVAIHGLGDASLKGVTTSSTGISSSSTDGTLPTAKAVYNAIDNLPKPMIYKGTLGTGGTITTLPTVSSENEGFTYKVITDGTYASQAAKVGDVFISNGSTWTLLPAGDDVEDTWRQINVNGTQLLGTGISTGAVNFKNGDNITISGSGNDITISASQPTVNNATLTIQKNGTMVNTFTANASSNVTANITVPTNTNELTNGAGFITNAVDNLTNYTKTTDLAAVATSGEYSDLSGKPVIPDNTDYVDLTTNQVIDGQKDFEVVPRVKVTHEVHNLPSEYQEVEYLESTGTQYINSGLTIDNNKRLEIEYYKASAGDSNSQWIFGTRLGFASNAFGLNYYTNQNPAYKWTNHDGVILSNFIDYRAKCVFDLVNLEITFIQQTTTTILIESGSVANDKNLYLFAKNDNGVANAFATIKLYSCQLFDNGTLVRNFVPCYRKVDNVAGLYDLVNGVFYINAGTGDFVLGPNVEPITYESLLTDASFGAVAFSNNYNDLDNKPTIPTNLENGTGTNAIRQKMADATVNFTGRNPNAEALDSSLSATLNTGASGSQSAAFGKNTVALSATSLSSGNKTVAKGEESHAEGYQSVTLGDGSHAEGAQTVAYGLQSHSEGALTQALGDESHAEGHSTIAAGLASHAEGSDNKIGSYSPAANQGANQSGGGGGGGDNPPEPGTFTAGEGSHAEGYSNLIVGFGSHAEGLRNHLTGNYAHVEGVNNTNSANYAHVEGHNNINSGEISHVEGSWNNNSGYNAHIFGHHNTNTYDHKVIFGWYNSNKSNTILEVGKGDSLTRSNAFEVYQDGHATVGGKTIATTDDLTTLVHKGSSSAVSNEDIYGLKTFKGTSAGIKVAGDNNYTYANVGISGLSTSAGTSSAATAYSEYAPGVIRNLNITGSSPNLQTIYLPNKSGTFAIDSELVHKGSSSAVSNEDIYGTKTFKNSTGITFVPTGQTTAGVNISPGNDTTGAYLNVSSNWSAPTFLQIGGNNTSGYGTLKIHNNSPISQAHPSSDSAVLQWSYGSGTSAKSAYLLLPNVGDSSNPKTLATTNDLPQIIDYRS